MCISTSIISNNKGLIFKIFNITLICLVIALIVSYLYMYIKNAGGITENFDNIAMNDIKSILLETPKADVQAIEVVNNNDGLTVIPKNIFTHWNTKELPPKMSELVNKIKAENPDFNIYIYDDEECRKMIEKYFIPDVLNAFDTLIPFAYKSDLWRYCVLYLYGGIYIDIKFQPQNGFKFIELTDKEYYTQDPPGSGETISNGIMICKKNSVLLDKAIKKLITNVKNKYHGNTHVDPTGPLMLKNFFSKYEHDNLELRLVMPSYDDMNIYRKDRLILKMYPEYRTEQKKNFKDNNTKSYIDLWREKKIYKE